MLAVWVVSTAVIALRVPGGGHLAALLAMVTALSVLGFIDDARHLSPLLRFTAQVLICGLAVTFGLGDRVLILPGLSPLGPSVLAIPLWTIILVLLVNIFNFMDGIDGLVAGQTLLAAVVLSAIALLIGSPLLALAAATLAGTVAGFLPFNWSPARCFMGDAGSYFCGGALAGLWLFGQRRGLSPVLEALPASAFLLDALITLVRRTTTGERPWRAHRSHLYQRLVARGWSHARVTECYLATGGATGAASLLLVAWLRPWG
jgi:Fuc2NAc and GlcNAc transferase